MLLKIVIGVFFVTSFLNCSKEHISRPSSYLNLRVEGYDEDMKWESITGEWDDSLGNMDIEASSSFFDRCEIHLKNLGTLGAVNPLSISDFYYTDGLDFRPYAVSGKLTITTINDKEVRGSFDLRFENNYNGVSGRRITGDFGVINDPY